MNLHFFGRTEAFVINAVAQRYLAVAIGVVVIVIGENHRGHDVRRRDGYQPTLA